MPRGVPNKAEPRQAMGDAEAQGAQVRNEQQIRDLTRRGNNTVVMPGGMRIDGTPYLGVRVNIGNQTDLLGNPRAIIRRDRQDPHCEYVWYRRDNNVTSSWINAGWLRPVRFEDIDKSNPTAFVQEVQMPAGPRPEDGMESRVVWGPLILCAMPREVHDKVYRDPERAAIGQQAAMNLSLAEMFEKIGVRAEFEEPAATRETVNIAAGAPAGG